MDSFGIEIPSQARLIVFCLVAMYFVLITGFGTYFSKFSRNINDFFYSGQRFAWWIPAISMLATGIGSYSYLKYSQQGLKTGMSSAMTYTNGWFMMPLFMFGWLPIIYLARVKSIPEYFERRFNSTARYIAVVIILCYMFYYIGYNLFTIGVAIEGMFGFKLAWSVPIVALFLGAYVTFGGQTAVIFTDLFQGVMLYLAGFIAIAVGVYALGGLSEWWGWLPETHRIPFTHLNENPRFNTTGLFWGEALAGSIAFTFMNQGFIMRYLTIKSVDEGRKAAVFNVLVTLPVSAIIVGAVGWIAKSILTKQAALGGALPGYNLIEIENAYHTFIIVTWETLKQNPWLFGLIIAALTAALMSTIDTLINACAAVAVYDIYKPLIKKEASDKHYLGAARVCSILTTVLGSLLVIWFVKQKGTLMDIHYKGIMTIIPAMVATILLGAFWRGLTPIAACVAMVAGSALTVMTNFHVEWLYPLSGCVLGPTEGDPILMRALFGLVVTSLLAVGVSFFTKPKPKEAILGLTADTIEDAMRLYKGAEPNHEVGEKVKRLPIALDESLAAEQVSLSPAVMERLKARPGDMIYMEDSRWYLGGLRSLHTTAVAPHDRGDDVVVMSPSTMDEAYITEDHTVTLEKIF